ncbi:primosomal protein [Rhodococcus sp. Z13]|uniref:Primosomal protein n=1 Tax=Rhodococcus sacchari TaxID=2962047 RepID=A0ACD4DDY7_9NOCA|nr:primosomal protein [Rhodococcus sp. Z13]UYP17893.1 primosomal protein [Rhodococcus sp. Z13]
MAGDIVPIELCLTDGNVVTLWVPRWRDGDDEWQAFLGHGDDLYVFPGVAELVAFVRSGADNDLADHETWPVVSKLAASEFEPDELHRFDVVGVPELVAERPEPLVVSKLQDVFDVVAGLGDACELDAVTSFFERPEIAAVVDHGPSAFQDRAGRDLWNEVGRAVVDDWDAVIDALDGAVSTPDVAAAAVSEAESELVAADENEVEIDDTVEDVDSDDEYEFVDTDEDEDEDDFWVGVGIDPVRIITTEGSLYTLRCYLDDDALFLGSEGTIYVFPSERALARYLADNHDHDLAGLETYDELRVAAIDGSLEVTVSDDNVYVLTGIADDITEGVDAVDPEQLELAVELFTDAADYADDDSTDAALAASTELGWFVAYVLEPDSGRRPPSPPFDAEALAWRELEREFEARLRRF